MAFSRPTLATIAARVKTDVQGALAGTAAFFKRSFERGMAGAVTGASHLLHGHLDWIAAQFDPSKADYDQLIRVHAAPIGMTQKQAVKANLRITANGTNGTVVSTGQLYTRADSTRYTVDAPGATVSGGGITLFVTAETAGEAGNCEFGTFLLQGTPIAGLNDDAQVAATIVDGSDTEEQPEFLQRYLLRRRTPPRGGAPGDYVTWILEVAGVTRAWEYPRRAGAGTVTAYAVNDAGSPTIALSPTKITEIETYVDQPGRQPSTVDFYMLTPTLQSVAMTISIKPNTVDVQNAIIIELDEAIKRAGNPGGMTLLWSELNEAISIAPGETDHVLVVPAANVAVPFGSMPVRGAITWQTLP